MSKMKPMTARNRASAIVVAALGLLVFVCYSCSAKADTMLGKMSDPAFMGVKAKAKAKSPPPMPSPPPPSSPSSDQWIIDVIAMVDGKIAAAATYGDAVYPSELLCENAVKADARLNASAATALELLGKDNPGSKIAIVIACALKVN